MSKKRFIKGRFRIKNKKNLIIERKDISGLRIIPFLLCKIFGIKTDDLFVKEYSSFNNKQHHYTEEMNRAAVYLKECKDLKDNFDKKIEAEILFIQESGNTNINVGPWVKIAEDDIFEKGFKKEPPERWKEIIKEVLSGDKGAKKGRLVRAWGEDREHRTQAMYTQAEMQQYKGSLEEISKGRGSDQHITYHEERNRNNKKKEAASDVTEERLNSKNKIKGESNTSFKNRVELIKAGSPVFDDWDLNQ